MLAGTPKTQCAAVRTYRLFRSVPPQIWARFERNRNAIWKGKSWMSASLPPTIAAALATGASAAGADGPAKVLVQPNCRICDTV